MERALLWESIQDEIPLYNISFEDDSKLTRASFPSLRSYPATRSRLNQSARIDNDASVIRSGFSTIAKALSVRIVDSFLDDEKLAYTIWVYNVEKREEWYAPIRYTHDFSELREATSRMSKSVERIDFPSSGWFSSLATTEASESQSSREARCFRLEAFLRELFKAIYLHPLTPNSAEIALYVQTFLGVDSCTERLIHFSPNYYDIDTVPLSHILGQDTMQCRLLIAVQLYTYRIFLLGAMSRLVSVFIGDMRRRFGSSIIMRDGLEIMKATVLNALKGVKSFLFQIQTLILDGCINDLREIASHSEYLIILDASKGEHQSSEETFFLEAIRSQVEVEVYIPLRTSISKDLTNLWRYDDIEILRKIKV